MSTVFNWENIKAEVVTLFKNIALLGKTAISEIFSSIPSTFTSLFSGVLEWLKYITLKVKNSIVESVQGAINTLGEKIHGTWVGDLFGWGKNLETFEFKLDKTEEETAKTNSEKAFSSISTNFSEALSGVMDRVETFKTNTGELSEIYSKIKAPEYKSFDYTDKDAKKVDNSAFLLSLRDLASKAEALIEDNSEESTELLEKFSALMSPVIENWQSTQLEGLGDILSEWKAEDKEEYYKRSGESLVSIKDLFSEWGKRTVEDGVDGIEDIFSSLGNTFSSLFSDDISSFSMWLGEFLKEEREKQKKEEKSENKELKAVIKEQNKTLSSLSVSIHNAFYKTNKEGTETSIFDSGSALERVEGNLTSTISSFFSSVSLLTDAFSSGRAEIVAINEVLKGFFEIITPAVSAVIQPLFDSLGWVGRVIGESILPLLSSLTAPVSFITRVLSEVLSPILAIIAPYMELLSSLLMALSPIIALMGKAITTVMAPIEYMADLFSWLGRWLKFFGDCVGVAAWNITHWFDTRSFPSSPGGFKSDAFSGLSERLNAWDSLTLETSSSATLNPNLASSLSSSSYQGGTTITVNIYQEAPLIGEGGMRQFATMIREELETIDYYGVTG